MDPVKCPVMNDSLPHEKADQAEGKRHLRGRCRRLSRARAAPRQSAAAAPRTRATAAGMAQGRRCVAAVGPAAAEENCARTRAAARSVGPGRCQSRDEANASASRETTSDSTSPPAGENDTAFRPRLATACRSRNGSPPTTLAVPLTMTGNVACRAPGRRSSLRERRTCRSMRSRVSRQLAVLDPRPAPAALSTICAIRLPCAAMLATKRWRSSPGSGYPAIGGAADRRQRALSVSVGQRMHVPSGRTVCLPVSRIPQRGRGRRIRRRRRVPVRVRRGLPLVSA